MATINFWLMPNAGFDSKQTIDRELALFRRAYPGLDVNYEIHSWSRAWPRLMQAIKDKAGPDVIQVGTTWISTLGHLGAVQPLDGKHINRTSFIPTFFAMCKSQERLWAVPWFCEGRVLYYRKDYLKKALLTLSDIDTWEGFAKSCAKIAALQYRGRSVLPIGFSCQKEQAVLQDLAPWIWSHGGEMLSPDGKHAALDRAEARTGIKFFLDLITAGHISGATLEETAGEVCDNFFQRGEYAFLFSSSWPLQVYLNPSSKNYVGSQNAENFGVTPIPQGPSGRFNFAGGSGLAVTSFSKVPDKAWKLVEFLTERESLSRYCKNINMFPSRYDVTVSLNIDKESQEVFQNAVNLSGRSFLSHPLWGSIEQVLLNGLVQVLRDFNHNKYNQTTFFHSMAEINQEIEYILSVFGE